MLEKGETYVGQAVVRALARDEHRFGTFNLAPMEMLAACPVNSRVTPLLAGRGLSSPY
jgi:hypothetical protein